MKNAQELAAVLLTLGRQLTVYNALVLACSNLFLDDSEMQRESLAGAIEAQIALLEDTLDFISAGLPSLDQAQTPEQQAAIRTTAEGIEEARAKIASGKGIPISVRNFRIRDQKTHHALTRSIT